MTFKAGKIPSIVGNYSCFVSVLWIKPCLCAFTWVCLWGLRLDVSMYLRISSVAVALMVKSTFEAFKHHFLLFYSALRVSCIPEWGVVWSLSFRWCFLFFELVNDSMLPFRLLVVLSPMQRLTEALHWLIMLIV